MNTFWDVYLSTVTSDIGFNCFPLIIATLQEEELESKILAISLSIIGLTVFLASRIFQEVAVRFGLPTVLGDLIAGLVIGISGFHIAVFVQVRYGESLWEKTLVI